MVSKVEITAKVLKGFGLAMIVSLCTCAHAQVYSQNVVGYVNQLFYSGDNLIADQFGYSNNTLNAIFQPGVPEGATFTEWNPTTLQYLPVSTYDTGNGWSINYQLSYRQGGLFNSPSFFTNVFVGTVWPGLNLTNNLLPLLTPPVMTDGGSFLLSCLAPIAPATFYDVIGRDPQDGESVTILDAVSQISTTTTYADGVWDNGAPALNVGQAAMFNLEAVTPVPEPATYELVGVGLLSLMATRRLKRRS